MTNYRFVGFYNIVKNRMRTTIYIKSYKKRYFIPFSVNNVLKFMILIKPVSLFLTVFQRTRKLEANGRERIMKLSVYRF